MLQVYNIQVGLVRSFYCGLLSDLTPNWFKSQERIYRGFHQEEQKGKLPHNMGYGLLLYQYVFIQQGYGVGKNMGWVWISWSEVVCLLRFFHANINLLFPAMK